MSKEIENLNRFISDEKAHFNSQKTNINWNELDWKIKDWLFHRGDNNAISFDSLKRMKLPKDSTYKLPIGTLPPPYIDFVKALAVYVHRTKKIGYMAVRNYTIECRRLFIIMAYRNESCPTQLTRWHFEETLQLLIDVKYKNLYDAAANLQAIADIIDNLNITPLPISFKHSVSQNHRNNEAKSIRNIDDQERKDEDKLPSYEAMKAYAIATNNPINDNEEILLRTIDLLIAMGQRGNEVTVLPLDCWVEKIMVSKSTGEYITDAKGNYIKKIGIRYFAEKLFKSRVHWLADQDVPLAKRAYERLVLLTEEAREVALWQENNPGKIWEHDPETLLDDDFLIKYLKFNRIYNLQLFTKKNNIKVHSVSQSYNRKPYYDKNRKYNEYKNQHYFVKDIEKVLLPKLSDHIILKESTNGKWKTILKTSETLSIAFEGAFRFKERNDNLFKVYPIRLQIKDINIALGAVKDAQSIFERRGLTEADGSKIVMTSHRPRHWRNTLYELAGMSNVQQALAMGRQRLDQNPAYQHTNIKERTEFHKDFIAFNSITEKVNFLQNGVRDKKILGSITDTYHFLKEDKGIQSAEDFLKTHALAIHITPFGGCTHDFSQSPCMKHLQCWNGCSHLHRTDTPGETERIKEQLDASINVLNKMKADSDDYGKDVWIQDLEKKIENLKKGVAIKPSETPTQVFPNGVQMTIPIDFKPKSSVK